VNALRDLGSAIGTARRDCNDDPARFAATAALLIPHHVAADSIAHRELWAALADLQEPSPPALSPGVSITLVREATYSIAVEAWTGGSTDIREPGFAGAVAVIRGSALIAPHHFTPDAGADRRCALGAVTAAPPVPLGPGASTPIDPGLGHAWFALEPATLVVVVRGHWSTASAPRRYLTAGLAFDPASPPALHGVLASLTLQRTTKDPGLTARCVDLAAGRDGLGVVHMVRHLAPMLPPAQLAALIAAMPARHAALCARLLDDDRRERDLAVVRHAYDHAVGPALRSFLAVLLLVRGRRDVLATVAARMPGIDPVEPIVGWLRELAGQPGPLRATPNLAGFDLDDTVLEVVRARLTTDSDAAAVAQVVAHFAIDAADVPVLTELMSALRRAPLLTPLLA
jgi:hypothetical protein